MHPIVRNTKGFIHFSVLAVLPILMAFYLTAALAVALSQQYDLARTKCVQKAYSLQEKILLSARKLFNLNKTSTVLRKSITATEAALLVAKASGQVQAIAPLEAQLTHLKLAQKSLDQVQKLLIYKMQTVLITGHVHNITSLNQQAHNLKKSWHKIITSAVTFKPQSQPRLAIQPDSIGGIGPNYEWHPKAYDLQELAYNWNMFFQTNNSFQTLLSWTKAFKMNCSTSPDVKDQLWTVKINVDK